MDFDRFGDLAELTKELPNRIGELTTMLDCAYVGSRLNGAFILRNAAAYSELDSKAVLSVIAATVPPERKDIVTRSMEIVGYLRKNKVTSEGRGLLSVLGSVKTPFANGGAEHDAEIELLNKQAAAWDSAYASIPAVDIAAYDLSDDERLDACIEAINERGDAVASKVSGMLNAANERVSAKAAESEVSGENDKCRKEWLNSRIAVAVKPILQALAPIYALLFTHSPKNAIIDKKNAEERLKCLNLTNTRGRARVTHG